MSLIINDSKENDSRMGIWEITESESYFLDRLILSEKEKQLLNNAKTKRRRIELLSVRLLLKSLDLELEISYTQTGKPVLNEGNISISHTKQYAAILFHKKKKVAIDIEKVSSIPFKGKHLVFNKSEIGFAENNLELLTTLWCCKECVVKMTNNVNINYLTQISVFPFTGEGLIECDYLHESKIDRYQFHQSRICDHIIVWGICDLIIIDKNIEDSKTFI